jgi:hypothetical protein
VENRRRFPLEEVNKCAGQWVAWSVDGSKIVAHHEDLMEVSRMVKAAGLDHEDVIFDHIPQEGEGGAIL